ncbi:hypothetical protein ACQJBY_054544 [Aegilops geniculata]
MEANLESTKERGRDLSEKLVTEKTSRKDAESNLTEQCKVYYLWTEKLIGIAERLSSHLANMDMKSWRFTINEHEAASTRLTNFFEGLIEALKTYQDNRAASFANESRQFARSVLYMVLLNVAHHNPDLDLSGIFKKLPEDTNITAADKIVAPLANRVPKVPRIQGDRQD